MSPTPGTVLLREHPELAPEVMATFGAVIGRLPSPGESSADTARATESHRAAGTDLGPLTDRLSPDPGGNAVCRRVELSDLLFDGEDFSGLGDDDLRGSAVCIWQIRDPALRAIALEASELRVDVDELTCEAILATLQHGSSPLELERARRDLRELEELGAGARINGREPLEPRPDHVVIRRGLQQGNVAGVAAGLLASTLPEDVGPRILRLGARIETPHFQVPWISERGIETLEGAVSGRIVAALRPVPCGLALIDDHLERASTAVGKGRRRGIAPAALLLADLPDDPRLPPLVFALHALDVAGKLTEPPETVLAAVQREFLGR